MKIVCKDQQGGELTFESASPCWITSVDGLGANYNVYTSKNSGQDGEGYNGSDAEKRNIVITLEILTEFFLEYRNKIYNFFQPRAPGILYYYEGNESKKIAYYAEKVEPSGDGSTHILTISLICPDPKFYALTDQLTQLAVWQGCIRFPLRIVNPFHVTEKVNTLIGNVRNDSAVPMGLTVTFRATGTVVNPSLYDVNRHELMQINTTMYAGDVIIITTGDGNKRVKQISGGTTTNISNLMQYPPKWLQAYQGDNLFRYNAASGIDALSVSILSTPAYWGA